MSRNIDFFVSYKDGPRYGNWIREFVEMLKYRTVATLGEDGVYFAPESARLKNWECDLFENLRKTKIFIAIYTKDYFCDSSFGLKEMAYFYHRYLKFQNKYKNNSSPIVSICLGDPNFFNKNPGIEIENFSDTLFRSANSKPTEEELTLLAFKTKELCDRILTNIAKDMYPEIDVDTLNKDFFNGFEDHIPYLKNIYNIRRNNDYPPPSQVS